MSKGKKRTSSSGRAPKTTNKRARFRDIGPSVSQQVGTTSANSGAAGLAARETDSHIFPTGPQPVTVENRHIYSSSDGRRLAQQTNTRSVTVSAAKWVFRKIPLANAGTDSSEPASTQLDPENDDGVALDAAGDEEESVNEVAAKKRVRTDLRAAVRPGPCHHNIDFTLSHS